MKMIFVTPEKGMKIRNPANSFSFLDPAGEVVPHDDYWVRRQAEGGVKISDPPAKKKPAKATAKPDKA